MTRELFEELMTHDETEWEGDNALQGLLIIAKYFDIKKYVILEAAEHDEIYSVDVDKLIEAGITEEDTIALRKLNWMIEKGYDCLSCFV